MDGNQLIFWTVAALMAAGSVLLLIRPMLRGDSGADHGMATAITWLVPGCALGLYLAIGRPELTAWHTRPVVPPFLAGAVEKLTADVRDHPTDVQAWLLLGGVDERIQHWDEAAAAYRRAAELDPGTPVYKSLVGRAEVEADGDAVGADALRWFGQAPDDPLARYYLALATAQGGNWAEAMAGWEKLRAELPANSPLRDSIDHQIADSRRALGLDRH